jgi:hypothetical protein
MTDDLKDRFGLAAVMGEPRVIGEEHSGYVRLRPAWRENLLWLSLIVLIVSATIFLLH